MRRSLWAIGERTISGQYRRIMSAGDLNIEDSDILKLYSAGDIDIKNCFIKKLRAAGDIKAVNSNFDDISLAGDIKLEGETKAGIFAVCGDLNAEYLSCKVLRNYAKNSKTINNGRPLNSKISGFIKAETFENFTDITMEFEYEFNNIISKCRLEIPGSLECERLYSFGEISADEINADYIYVKPLASSEISNITGSEIVISKSFNQDKIFKLLPKSIDFAYYNDILSRPSSIMSIGSIEADKVYADYLKADFISGGEIVIGDLCIIEKVEYSKSIQISPKAVVNEVVKL